MRLSFPLLIYFLVVLFLDPFNYLGGNNENNLARSIEPHLYKMISHTNTPRRNIILGDSRSNALYPIIQKNRNSSWSNLAYGGASLKEMIDTFWWLDENYHMDTVVINVNFNHLNDYNKRDWIISTKRLMQSPISYAFSRYVLLYLFQKSLPNKREVHTYENKSKIVEKDIFWNSHLLSIKKKFYGEYKYSQSYLNDLNLIASRCKERRIKLIIWSAPVHKDIHEIIDFYGNSPTYLNFVSDLDGICQYYDFNARTEWLADKENFNDAMHVKGEIMNSVFETIFEK